MESKLKKYFAKRADIAKVVLTLDGRPIPDTCREMVANPPLHPRSSMDARPFIYPAFYPISKLQQG